MPEPHSEDGTRKAGTGLGASSEGRAVREGSLEEAASELGLRGGMGAQQEGKQSGKMAQLVNGQEAQTGVVAGRHLPLGKLLKQLWGAVSYLGWQWAWQAKQVLMK